MAQAVDLVGALELLVHTWDLARATGGDDGLEPADAARLHESLRPHEAALRATGAFERSLPAEPGDDAVAAFLRFTGRRP